MSTYINKDSLCFIAYSQLNTCTDALKLKKVFCKLLDYIDNSAIQKHIRMNYPDFNCFNSL